MHAFGPYGEHMNHRPDGVWGMHSAQLIRTRRHQSLLPPMPTLRLLPSTPRDTELTIARGTICSLVV